MKKEYLLAITTASGADFRIGYYPDTPDKNYRLYYNGSDTGDRYDRVGNASRAVLRLAENWRRIGLSFTETHGCVDDVPHRGSIKHRRMK